MVIIDEAVSTALRQQSPQQVRIFVACCAERVAQIFTGLRGDTPRRAADVEVTLRLLDDLWNADLAGEAFRAHHVALANFLELKQIDSDVELVDSSEIFATYAIEIVHYAATFRSADDVDEALECAHMSLTLADLMDQNSLTENSFDHEGQYQLSDLAAVTDEHAMTADHISSLREHYRSVGRERFLAVQSQ